MYADEKVYFCIDIGGTKTALAYFDAQGNELYYDMFATFPERGAEDLAERILHSSAGFPRAAEAKRGVVAAPGPLDAKRGVIVNAVLLGWINVHITAILESKLHIPFKLINDCDAGALGVFHYGGFGNEDTLAYISVSTGIGGGLIIGGELYSGSGNAADFGHIRVSGEGIACKCGKVDCVELYASGLGITRGYFQNTGKTLPCEEIAELARSGDESARRLFVLAGRKLAEAVGSIVTVADPACFVFGGSVCKSADLWLDAFTENSGITPYFAQKSGKQVLLGALHIALSR